MEGVQVRHMVNGRMLGTDCVRARGGNAYVILYKKRATSDGMFSFRKLCNSTWAGDAQVRQLTTPRTPHTPPSRAVDAKGGWERLWDKGPSLGTLASRHCEHLQ